MPLTVTPADVPELIPDAPEPEQIHLTLATLWAWGELLKRRVLIDSLTGNEAAAARTAIAAKALAYKAGFGGTLNMLGGRAKPAVKKFKLGPIEGELVASLDAYGTSTVAASALHDLAVNLLMLLQPGPSLPVTFPGAAR